MNPKRRSFLSALSPVLLAALFLFVGRDSWLIREVAVSVGLKSSVPQRCQLYWTESPDEAFSKTRSAFVFSSAQGVSAVFRLPAPRVERLRIDFGNGGHVRAGKLVVSGSRDLVLDWNEFSVRHDIASFDIDGIGAVNVSSSGNDPYAICTRPIGINARFRPALLPFVVLLVLASLLWFPLAGRRGVLWNASPRNGVPVCSVPFLLVAVFLVAARFCLSARMPPAFFRSPWDDLWFVNAADTLLKGQWLGAYDQHTLIKGVFGPMALAVSHILGIPFLVTETCLYVLSCLFFIFVAARFSKNRIFLLLSLALLLFNPLSMAMGTFQRVHRNGMPLWQVPLVFGLLFLSFLDSGKGRKTLLKRSLVAGLALWMFQNTREDGIWLWPFAFVCMSFSAFSAWKAGRTPGRKFARAVLCFVPIAVLMIGNAAVCLVNLHAYGLPLRNDRDAGNYAKVMQDLYVMAPDPEDEARLTAPEHAGHYHGIYWSTVQRAFEESPTFRRARRGIEDSFDQWAKGAGYHGRDLYEDKPLFAIREGAARSGFYSSLRTSESFWGAVHAELSDAFESGRIRRRGYSFTAMAAPFQIKNVPAILSEWLRAVAAAASFRDTEVRLTHSEPFWETREWNDRLHEVSGERFYERADVRYESLFVARANRNGRLYSVCMPFVLVIALAAFSFVTSAVFRKSSIAVRGCLWPGWLFGMGLLASFFVHTAAIGYMTATTFWSTVGSYMTASYQLELMFVVVVAGLCIRFYELRRSEDAILKENA